MDLAKNLLRITARAFYSVEDVLIVDALGIHSTLTDADLAHCLGTNKKELRKQCGKLKDAGLISVQTRAEKKEDAPPPSTNPNFKNREHVKHVDWYWLHFHPAIDAIKYRLSRLSKHIDSMGAPTTEKKDLECPRCKSQYTDLEVMDNIDPLSGSFLCHLCEHPLDPVAEDFQENESKMRLNTQVAAIEALLREIDQANVPENDFDTALSLHLPINRGDAHPDRPTRIAEEVKPSIAGSKGLALAPETVKVQLEDDITTKPDPEAARIKREKEAKQNALPEWLTRSTVSGDMTTAGAKELREQREREAHAGGLSVDDAADDKKLGGTPGRDDAVMDDYWAAYRAEQERARLQEEEEEEEEDEDDEDEFEDVPPGASVPDIKVEEAEGPDAKRVKTEQDTDAVPLASVAPAVDANAESDEDDMEFEDV
ncbi:hypothetical protein KCU77_g11553, partial [Aureobasidium melanogenum]